MGKNKGRGMGSMLEAYMSSLEINTNGLKSETPLPDSMRVSTLLEQIGAERSWTSQQMESDISILAHNRLYFVRDLRVLSFESWKVITLLPIVKDLLQIAINVGIESEYDRRKREKYERKAGERKGDKKKEKKKDKHKVDSLPNELTEDVPFGVTSDDPATIRNTLQNSSTSLSGANGILASESDTVLSPRSMSHKIVSFDNEPAIIETKERESVKEGAKAAKSSDTSDSSDTETSSESTSDDDRPLTRVPEVSTSKPTTPYRKIKASGNKVHVMTSSGQAYECDRYCPHKGVDLVTWGQVVGNNIICTKHNWSFALDRGGTSNKASRSLHACKINDW
ncbi:hypothetical protein BGW37DRAFT_505578 [Umbelopsis sp. PMI_123]|nr:hypothetical protein BGW37DRAFT_505578 [Umbelopsis sp. PMI_123]